MITMTCLIGVTVALSGDGFCSAAALAKGAAMANWNTARVASPRRKECTPFERTDVRLIFPPVSAWFGLVVGFVSELIRLFTLRLQIRVLRESIPSFLHPRVLEDGSDIKSRQSY